MQSCNYNNELHKESCECCLFYESFEMAPATNLLSMLFIYPNFGEQTMNG
jgi:hypothetical protein